MKEMHPRELAYLIFLLTIPLGEVAPVSGCGWLTVTKLGFLLLLGVLAYSFYRGWRPPRPSMWVCLPLVALSLAACLAASLSGAVRESGPYAVRIVGLCILCFATMLLAAEPGFIRKALAALACAAALCALLGIYQTITGGTIGGLGCYGYFGRMIALGNATGQGGAAVIRASAAFDHPNILGTFLVGTLPAAIFLAIHHRERMGRLLYGIASMLLMVALVYTFSRSAWVGGLVGVSVILIAGRRAGMRALALVVLALAIAVVILPSDAKDVLFSRTGEAQPYDSGRVFSWHTAGRMIAAHPILGVGPGLFHDSYSDYADPEEVYRQNPLHHMDAHNTYLDLAAEGGLVTSLLFCAILGVVFMRLWSRAREGFRPPHGRSPGALPVCDSFGVPLLAGFAAISMQSLLQSLQYEEIWWVLMGLSLSLAYRGGPLRSGAEPLSTRT
jgi:putative inorganic carbon (hco3(-)) transporter